MSSPQKSNPSRIPFYFAARRRDRTPPRSDSEALEAQQNVDLHAEDLKPAELRRLKRDLELFNATGRIVTFDKVLKDWTTWNRYVFRFLTCSYLMFH
jgi:tRNA A37 N6-isopentenylltransferase MiaA